MIHSRKHIDNNGPKSADRSANFQMTPCVRTVSAARTASALLRGSHLDASTSRQEFEQLHKGWPWSGLARVGPTTPKQLERRSAHRSVPYPGTQGTDRAYPSGFPVRATLDRSGQGLRVSQCQVVRHSGSEANQTLDQSLNRSCKVHALRRIIRTGSRAVRASLSSTGRRSRSAMTFAWS